MKRPLIAAALVAALLAAPALAASNDFEMAVTFDRANADTPEGASVEYRTIRTQIVERCAAEHENFQVGQDLATSLCTARTLNKVISAINIPALTEVHAARTAG